MARHLLDLTHLKRRETKNGDEHKRFATGSAGCEVRGAD